MRRIVAFAALMLLLACMWIPVAGVGSYAEEVRETVTLYVYNWGEYISDGSEGCMDVNAEFENYFNENLAQEFGYKVKVNYSTYSSNEDMYAKVSSGAVAYDVIIPSDYMIERMAEEGLLHPLNFDNVPNFEENILDEFKNPEYDPENRYSVPYCYGMVGIIYNANVVDEDGAVVFQHPWLRLCRRIVRDYKFRGSDANFTLKMWPNVRRGEKLYISPYKENADIMFDSSLPDEMAVLKPFVVPLLEALPKGKYAIADDILRGYEKIASMDEAYIAPNSLVREFIGGSIYAS